MGLFSKKAIIDNVHWEPDGNEVIYAWKYPEDHLSTYTQLTVHETQEAVLFHNGNLLGKFGPGKRTLNTENLPLLREFFGFMHGGDNPFTAKVWFVNKIQTFAIDWEIAEMSTFDTDYQTQVPLVAKGQYGLKVVDSEKFILKFVGTCTKFTQDDMTRQSYGEICSKAKSLILQYMLTKKIGFMQISAYLDALGTGLREQMANFWFDLGLELTKFYVNAIEVDKTTPEGRRIADAISQQATQKITGRTWQQEQMFDTARDAIGGFSNMSGQGSGGLLGGLMAMQMMNGMTSGVSGIGSGILQPAYDQPAMGGANANAAQAIQNDNSEKMSVHTIYCAVCSKKYMSNQTFCPHCGHKYNPCPKCGTDNSDNAKRCVSCGTSLTNSNVSVGGTKYCPTCGAQILQGAAFCANCGTRITAQQEDVCSRCGAALQPDAKFCPVCGNRR